MEFERVVKERRSIRKYKDEKVPHDVIMEIVDMARYAPSWKNTQIARYIVVENERIKDLLSSERCLLQFSDNGPVIRNAAALVLVTYIKERSGFERDGSYSTPLGDRWQNFDCGIAAQTFCLAAKSKGIGTGIMGYVSEEEIRKIIQIPEDRGIACMITLGYPDENPDAPERKESDELVMFIR